MQTTSGNCQLLDRLQALIRKNHGQTFKALNETQFIDETCAEHCR